MPFVANAARGRAVEVKEWVTPTGIELAAAGDLDAMGCRVLEQRLRRLVARWPGVVLTIDLAQAGRVDEAAAEGLVLAVVALRAGEARLAFAAKGGALKGLLARMGVTPEPSSGGWGRWPGDGSGMGYLMSGVTA